MQILRCDAFPLHRCALSPTDSSFSLGLSKTPMLGHVGQGVVGCKFLRIDLGLAFVVRASRSKDDCPFHHSLRADHISVLAFLIRDTFSFFHTDESTKGYHRTESNPIHTDEQSHHHGANINVSIPVFLPYLLARNCAQSLDPFEPPLGLSIRSHSNLLVSPYPYRAKMSVALEPNAWGFSIPGLARPVDYFASQPAFEGSKGFVRVDQIFR